MDKTMLRNQDEVVLWIEKVIESCITMTQLYSTSSLVENFYRLYSYRYPNNLGVYLKLRTYLVGKCLTKAYVLLDNERSEHE